jgi:hypothetical protein
VYRLLPSGPQILFYPNALLHAHVQTMCTRVDVLEGVASIYYVGTVTRAALQHSTMCE